MPAIYALVEKTLRSGYLSIEIEQQLQTIVSENCNVDGGDLDMLTVLKQAIAFGHVKRQAQQSQPLEFKPLEISY
jgi:hypothetical protein